jgi:serine/threonine-protein kinase
MLCTVLQTFLPLHSWIVSTAAVNPPPEDLRPGQVVDGRYRVEARLAHGGMATVYRAFDQRLERAVALKVIDAGLARRPEYVARFIREAKSAARLNHPNIVGVYDQSAIRMPTAGAGVPDDTLAYLAMEYVPGSTLRQLLGRRGRLTPRQAIQVIDAMLAGLGAAHRAGIVHRDVKPENVLVNDAVLAQSHSYSAALKVTDFGLARSVTADGSTLGGSLPGGGLVGTASYLAPELVRFGTCDQRSDVYSAGIVLFELLTGRKPFTAASPVEVAQQHVTSRVPAPSTLLPGLDPALDALVARATAREPGERPADANALRTQLRSVYAKLSDGALDFGAGAVRGAEATQPLRAAAGAGATRVDVAPTRVEADPRTAAAAVAGAGGSTRVHSPLPPVAPRRDPDEPYRYAAENRTRPRRYRGLIIFLVIVLLALAAGLGAWLWGSTHYQSMPSLGGLSESQAESALTNDGLKYTVTDASSATVQQGFVIGTSPGSDQPVAVGSTVTLTISSGPGQVSVPNVVGQSQSAATSSLTNAGFHVAVSPTTQYTADVSAGNVASYSPSGTQTQGSTITLVLSAGVGQSTVPDVTGMNINQAEQKLQGEGFQVATHHISVVFNTVLSQSPGGGQSTQPGGTVTLYY